MSSLSTATGEFGLDLFRHILQQADDQNIIFSPINISALLSVVLYGAGGETAIQMKKVLHFNDVKGDGTEDSSASEPERNAFWLTDAGSQCDRPEGIHSQFQALLSQLNKPSKDYELSMANRLYGANSFDFVPHFTRCVKELYQSGLEKVAFGKETEKTRKLINSWVESHTQGKIKELFPPGNLDADAALVLVNTLYFKGKWQFGFKEEHTKEAPFWVNKKESKNVPMMVQHGEFKFADIADPPVQVLELPYEGNLLKMVILLPKNVGDGVSSLRKLAGLLSYKKLKELTSNLSAKPVTVHLPRFKLEEKYDLKASLESMGMTLPFDKEKADLSGISQQHLYVSQVIHKSFVEVNEEGTEGAAGSGAVAAPVSGTTPDKYIPFVADHPFVLTITHTASDTVIFAGMCASP